MSRAIALWAVPRSVSTAFERMMRARGDLEVVHEPFLAFYYYGEDRVNDNFNDGIEPGPEHHWSAILERLMNAADERPVFFKDMAYYLRKCMTPELLANFDNTFLIRDPRKSLPSLYGMQPNATLEEAGFEQQLRLMRTVRELEPGPLVVVDAEELKRDPEPVVRDYCEKVGLEFKPEALEWDPGSPSREWKPWEDWHANAMQSTGFSEKPDSGRRRKGDVPPDVMERCIELYDEIVELAQSNT